jgi:hypothetical protein
MSEMMRTLAEVGACVAILAIVLAMLRVWLKGSGKYRRNT